MLTYPITKGFSIYKAYSCIEFVMSMLESMGYKLRKPAPQYTPDELLQIFDKQIWFQGNLLDYKALDRKDDNYFAPMKWRQYIQSGLDLREVTRRSLYTLRQWCRARKRV